MKELYAVDFKLSVGSSMGPGPWSFYPPGVELVQVPHIGCDEQGCYVHLTVRCEPEVGKDMGWIPFKKPKPSTE